MLLHRRWLTLDYIHRVFHGIIIKGVDSKFLPMQDTLHCVKRSIPWGVGEGGGGGGVGCLPLVASNWSCGVLKKVLVLVTKKKHYHEISHKVTNSFTVSTP